MHKERFQILQEILDLRFSHTSESKTKRFILMQQFITKQVRQLHMFQLFLAVTTNPVHYRQIEILLQIKRFIFLWNFNERFEMLLVHQIAFHSEPLHKVIIVSLLLWVWRLAGPRSAPV